MRYYYLAASLPPLVLGQKPEISFKEFEENLRLNLSAADLKKCRVIRLWTDLCNILAVLKQEHVQVYGNLTEKQLEESLLVHNSLPQYVFDFFDERDDLATQIRDFPVLFASFFREEIPEADGFLKKFLIFEREMRLVLLALRVKSLKKDLAAELQFEDAHDSFVVQILAQKDQPEYEPPEEYAGLKKIWENKRDDPLELAKSVIEYQLKKMDEMSEPALFSIDVILAYLAKLILVLQWNDLDEGRGETMLGKIKVEG